MLHSFPGTEKRRPGLKPETVEEAIFVPGLKSGASTGQTAKPVFETCSTHLLTSHLSVTYIYKEDTCQPRLLSYGRPRARRDSEQFPLALVTLERAPRQAHQALMAA